MKWVVRGGSETRQVEVERDGDRFLIVVDGHSQQVEMVRLDGAFASLRFPDSGRSFQITYQRRGNGSWRVGVGQREFDLAVLSPAEAVEVVGGARASGPSRLTAPIPGKVVAVKAAAGDEVAAGQPLVVLEAMKMENELAAEQPGRVVAVHVAGGDTVESGQLLIELE
jgi:3-methylcrotonyl-CoA carboxylase alpha subunit